MALILGARRARFVQRVVEVATLTDGMGNEECSSDVMVR